MNTTIIQNSWVAGEISPMLAGRVELDAFKAGARVIENFIPTLQGPVIRRPGTYHVGTTRKPSSSYLKARLIEFISSGGDYFVLEFTDLKARVYSVNLHAIVGSPTELTTTITEAELFEVRYALSKGALWIVHANHKPQMITYSEGTWAISEPTFTGSRTFSTTGNYPAIIAFFSGRLILGATTNEPTSIFLSKAPDAVAGTDNYLNFALGSLVGDAIYLQESDMGGTSLRWAAVARRLMVATNRQNWTETAASKPTPSDFDMEVVGYTGSANIQAALAENMLVYVSANGKNLRALVYSTEGGGYQDVLVTKLADHILSSGVMDLQIQVDPFPIIWIVRNDGTLVSITLGIADGVIAPARHLLGGGGQVESISVVKGSNGEELWVSVLRGTVRTIEYLRFDTDTALEAHYVDDGLRISQAASNTISGLVHLEGKTVDAVGDGAVLTQKTVVSGAVTYDRPVSIVHIGYPYTSVLEPQRPEVPANGTSQGKKKRIEKVILRINQSAGGSIGQSLTDLKAILSLTSGSYVFGSSPGLFTGDIEVFFSGIIDTAANIFVVQNSPMPFSVLAIMTRIAVMEV